MSKEASKLNKASKLNTRLLESPTRIVTLKGTTENNNDIASRMVADLFNEKKNIVVLCTTTSSLFVSDCCGLIRYYNEDRHIMCTIKYNGGMLYTSENYLQYVITQNSNTISQDFDILVFWDWHHEKNKMKSIIRSLMANEYKRFLYIG